MGHLCHSLFPQSSGMVHEEGPDDCKSQIVAVILHSMAYVECTRLRKIKGVQFTAWMQEGLIKLCPDLKSNWHLVAAGGRRVSSVRQPMCS